MDTDKAPSFPLATPHTTSKKGHGPAGMRYLLLPTPMPGQQLCLTWLSPHLNTALTSHSSVQKGKSTPSLSLMEIRFPSCMPYEMRELPAPPPLAP